MVRLQKNIIKGTSALTYFVERNFYFNIDKLNELFDELDADDKIKFNFNHSTIDWDSLTKDGIEQGRELLFKEGPETIPAAQRKLRKLYFINFTFKITFHLFVAYLILKAYSWFNRISES